MAEITNEPSLDEMKQERRVVLERLLQLSQYCGVILHAQEVI